MKFLSIKPVHMRCCSLAAEIGLPAVEGHHTGVPGTPFRMGQIPTCPMHRQRNSSIPVPEDGKGEGGVEDKHPSM